MSSGWLPKHRQLFFQILEEGPNAVTAAVHDGKREARQQRATLIAAASKAAKKGFREKDQEMTKVAVYNRKSILEPP